MSVVASLHGPCGSSAVRITTESKPREYIAVYLPRCSFHMVESSLAGAGSTVVASSMSVTHVCESPSQYS